MTMFWVWLLASSVLSIAFVVLNLRQARRRRQERERQQDSLFRSEMRAADRRRAYR